MVGRLESAEDVILAASIRIGLETLSIPKGRGPGGAKGAKTANPQAGKSTGRAATGVPKNARARHAKLARRPNRAPLGRQILSRRPAELASAEIDHEVD
jgi:hypothetical protein